MRKHKTKQKQNKNKKTQKNTKKNTKKPKKHKIQNPKFKQTHNTIQIANRKSQILNFKCTQKQITITNYYSKFTNQKSIITHHYIQITKHTSIKAIKRLGEVCKYFAPDFSSCVSIYSQNLYANSASFCLTHAVNKHERASAVKDCISCSVVFSFGFSLV